MIFIYDGSELIHGTQFDGDINDLQKKYARQFRSAHLPIVTVLVARNGQVFDYTINYPDSITVPHTAIALPPPTNAPPPAVVAAAAVPPTNSVPLEPSPPPRRIQIIMSGTNSVTRTITQWDSATNSPSSASSNIVMVTTQQSPPPAIPASIAEPIASNPPPPVPAPTPEAAAAEPDVVTTQPAPASVLPSAPPKIPPTPAPGTIPAAAPAPGTPPASVRAPVPLAVSSTGQQVALFVIAFSLLTIAVVLVVFLVRRSRGDGPPSLISQTIDRGR
jgi:hypothetical protein